MEGKSSEAYEDGVGYNFWGFLFLFLFLFFLFFFFFGYSLLHRTGVGALGLLQFV